MGRNRRKSGGDMYPWEGTQRKSEITQEDCILGSSSSSHRLGLIEGLWEVWTPLRGVFVLICTQGRVERDLLTFLQLSHQAPQCSPSKQSDSAQSITVQHWKWGGHDRGKDWTVGYRGDGVLCGGVFVAAIAGIYSRSSSKHAGSPIVAAVPHLTPSICWEARHAPPAQQRFSTAGWGRQRSLAIIDYEEQRKLTPQGCVQAESQVPAEAGCWNFETNMSKEPTQASLASSLLWDKCPMDKWHWDKCPMQGEKKHTSR